MPSVQDFTSRVNSERRFNGEKVWNHIGGYLRLLANNWHEVSDDLSGYESLFLDLEGLTEVLRALITEQNPTIGSKL